MNVSLPKGVPSGRGLGGNGSEDEDKERFDGRRVKRRSLRIKLLIGVAETETSRQRMNLTSYLTEELDTKTSKQLQR